MRASGTHLLLKSNIRIQMKFFLSILLLSTLLFATNPKIYAALGDTIYNNAKKIELLKNYPEYEVFKEKIDNYLKEVKRTKSLGFAIESGKSKENKKYLQSLRKLSKTNDFFVRIAQYKYKESMEKKDYDTFVRMVDSGLIDLERNKKQILDFYDHHSHEIIPYGALELLIQSRIKKQNPKHTKEYYERLRKQREAEKIRRLREKDKRRQEELQKRLEEELKRKKERIREEQIKELKKDL